jgi:hypothetical protein
MHQDSDSDLDVAGPAAWPAGPPASRHRDRQAGPDGRSRPPGVRQRSPDSSSPLSQPQPEVGIRQNVTVTDIQVQVQVGPGIARARPGRITARRAMTRIRMVLLQLLQLELRLTHDLGKPLAAGPGQARRPGSPGSPRPGAAADPVRSLSIRRAESARALGD